MPTAPPEPDPPEDPPRDPPAAEPSDGVATSRPRRVFIAVAEVSGDRHAAQLIRSLKELDPAIVVEGLGGPEMAAAGAAIHRDTVAGAAMGIKGALRAAEVWRLLRWARRHFDRHRPDLVIGVDSPSMNFHFARAAKERGIPAMQYVAPQLWAWAEWRMKKVRRWVDVLACILPFEEAYFRAHGVNARFVGHPLFDELPPHRHPPGDGRRTLGRPPVVGLLPGSRRSEAEANFGRLLDVAGRIERAFPGAAFLIPTTAATHPVVEAAVGGRQRALGRAQKAVGGEDREAGPHGFLPTAHCPLPPVVEYARDAFDDMVPRCDLCLTVSGTATLHVASFGVPMIVVYAGSRLMWNLVGRWLIRTRTYGLVNLLAAPSPTEADPAGHVVPEFIPWYGPTGSVADLAIDLLRHPDKLTGQQRRLESLVRSLDRPGASMNAARLALELLDRNRQGPPSQTAGLMSSVSALGAP